MVQRGGRGGACAGGSFECIFDMRGLLPRPFRFWESVLGRRRLRRFASGSVQSDRAVSFCYLREFTTPSRARQTSFASSINRLQACRYWLRFARRGHTPRYALWPDHASIGEWYVSQHTAVG